MNTLKRHRLDDTLARRGYGDLESSPDGDPRAAGELRVRDSAAADALHGRGDWRSSGEVA